MLFVFFSLIFRIWCIHYIKKDGKNVNKVMFVDFVILLIVIILFFTYEIVYVLNQYS